jgi:hypothetical protein
MVCYVVPAAAAIIHYGLRKTKINWKKSTSHLWLSLLLFGGAIFGIVDHLWNGELLMFGENLLLDISLGIAITITIIVVWAVLISLNKRELKQMNKQLN